MELYERVLRPLLFRLDAEVAHNWALALLAKGLFRARVVNDPRLPVEKFRCRFPNPLGVAAGLDKNARVGERWANLGFGFAEVGTVTLRRQPGNPKPRLFRLPSDLAIINRMGFNNDGAHRMASRLTRRKRSIPIGVNVGKLKATPADEAPMEYAECLRLLSEHADYVCVNVSSPNTPGLQELQERDALCAILAAMRAVAASIPILVKVSPDLTPNALDDVWRAIAEAKANGVVATNTTTNRSDLRSDPQIAGGLSGRPLLKRANATLSYLAEGRPDGMTLIGVGGIWTGEDVHHKLRLGADLVQIYTGWVYRGPWSTPRILTEYLACLDRETK